MRNLEFGIGEFYHVFNKGVDGRNITLTAKDSDRFIEGLIEFNSTEPINSLRDVRSSSHPSHQVTVRRRKKLLVNIHAYCLNPNHFHFILEQLVEGGISKFMKSVSGAYSYYFNLVNKRKGTLFQGPFRAKYVDSNEYLDYLSVYINLNDKVHKIVNSSLVRSGWNEYVNPKYKKGICKTDFILGQFKSRKDYENFSLEALKLMIEQKEIRPELDNFIFSDE